LPKVLFLAILHSIFLTITLLNFYSRTALQNNGQKHGQLNYGA